MNSWDSPTQPASEEDAEARPTRLGHFEIVGRLGSGGMGVVFDGRDTLLGRRVALKVLHPSGTHSAVAPARLLREAQTLARLSHPNVVTVYEVGMAGEDPFIAMELVEGDTLYEWMREPRDWREVLDLFIPVGHGLAALHALGLVHRDFKPSNVLLDRRGVPKLGDFGLVGGIDDSATRITTEPSPSPPSPASSDPGLTVPGSVMGTPEYMAPEQRRGDPVDARADQYGFAKTLREALREAAPAALGPILERALAAKPADRFPSMDALLAELARVRRGNRRRWIAIGATVVAIGAIAIAWAFGRAQGDADPCPPPASRVEPVWSAARRDALARHLGAIDPAFGRQRFETVAAVFDRGADRWITQHVEACRQSHEGRQSDALLDRRMVCLDRALFELDQTVGVVARATNAVTLDEAMRAAVQLPTLDECADVAALTEKLPQPASPLQRADAAAIARETVDLDVALRTGGTRTGITPRAEAIVARARALGHPETLSRALRSLAAIQLENEAGDAAVATLREAIQAASAAHDDRAVAELWGRLLVALVKLKRSGEAKTLVPAAEAAMARATTAVELQVAFLEVEGQVAAATGDIARAHELYAEAQKRIEAVGAADPRSPHASRLLDVKTNSALIHAYANDWPRMVKELRPLVALTDAQYGPDHPASLRIHFNLAVGLRHVRDDEGALVEFRAAARIAEARLAPSPNLVSVIQAVGSTLHQMGRYADSLPYLERALAMARQTMPPGDPALAGAIGDVGATLIELHRFDEARPLIDEQLVIFDKLAREGDLNHAHAVYNRANLEWKTNQYARAIPIAERAHAMYLKSAPDHYDADGALLLIGDCQLALKKWPAALAAADRVLAQADGDPELRAAARFIRGQALTGQGNAGAGLAEVRAARDEMVKLKLSARIAEVDSWLAKR